MFIHQNSQMSFINIAINQITINQHHGTVCNSKLGRVGSGGGVLKLTNAKQTVLVTSLVSN